VLVLALIAAVTSNALVAQIGGAVTVCFSLGWFVVQQKLGAKLIRDLAQRVSPMAPEQSAEKASAFERSEASEKIEILNQRLTELDQISRDFDYKLLLFQNLTFKTQLWWMVPAILGTLLAATAPLYTDLFS
jgi:hypothetical protein